MNGNASVVGLCIVPHLPIGLGHAAWRLATYQNCVQSSCTITLAKCGCLVCFSLVNLREEQRHPKELFIRVITEIETLNREWTTKHDYC